MHISDHCYGQAVFVDIVYSSDYLVNYCNLQQLHCKQSWNKSLKWLQWWCTNYGIFDGADSFTVTSKYAVTVRLLVSDFWTVCWSIGVSATLRWWHYCELRFWFICELNSGQNLRIHKLFLHKVFANPDYFSGLSVNSRAAVVTCSYDVNFTCSIFATVTLVYSLLILLLLLFLGPQEYKARGLETRSWKQNIHGG